MLARTPKLPNDFVLGHSAIPSDSNNVVPASAVASHRSLSKSKPQTAVSNAPGSSGAPDSSPATAESTSSSFLGEETKDFYRLEGGTKPVERPTEYVPRVYVFDFRSMPSAAVVRADGSVRLSGVQDVGTDYVSVFGKVTPRLPIHNDQPNSKEFNDLHIMDLSLLNEAIMPTPANHVEDDNTAATVYDIRLPPGGVNLNDNQAPMGRPASSAGNQSAHTSGVNLMNTPISGALSLGVMGPGRAEEAPSPSLGYVEISTPPLGVAHGSLSPRTFHDLGAGVPTIPLTTSQSLNYPQRRSGPTMPANALPGQGLRGAPVQSTVMPEAVSLLGQKRPTSEAKFNLLSQPRSTHVQMDPALMQK